MITSTFKKIVLGIILFSIHLYSFSQSKQGVAIISIDVNGLSLDKNTVTDMVRLEIEKIDTFELMDKYDIRDIMERLDIDVNTCYGKSRLIKVGQQLGVDKIITGSADRFGEKIIFTLKIIDIASKTVEKTDVMEYINQQDQIQIMARVSLNNLLGRENDHYIVDLLAYIDQPITSSKTTLELNGPRVGAFYNTGRRADKLMAPESEGGFDMYALSSMIGYQYEIQYLSSGNFQALIEMIASINGMESGEFVPSVAFLNGFRFSNTGFELGLGPVFRGVKMASGFYDNEGVWHLEEDLPATGGYEIVRDLDSRGDFELSTGLILAVGRTFRFGYLNVPINVYGSPNKDGWIYGVTCGFNVAKRPNLK